MHRPAALRGRSRGRQQRRHSLRRGDGGPSGQPHRGPAAQSAHSLAGPPLRRADQLQFPWIVQHRYQRLLRGRLSRGLGRRPQPAAQAPQAQRVGAAQRPGEQLGGRFLVERSGAQRAVQQGQQRPGSGLGGQRQLVTRDRHRNPGRGEGAPQHGHLTGRGTDEDRHRRPRQPVDQVRAAQSVGDDRGFLARGRGHDDPGRAGIGAGQRGQGAVGAFCLRVYLGLCGRQPGRDPARRGQQELPAAATGAQRDHLRGAPVGSTEPLGEPADRAGVGATEPVDRLVRVTDRDQLPAVSGQRVQQALLRGVSVLVLVDQDRVVGLALPLPGRGAAEQPGGDPDDLRVVVGGNGSEIEARAVPLQEASGRHPVIALPLLAQPGQPPPVQAPLERAEQEIPELGGEAPGAQRRAEPLRPAPAAVLGLTVQQPPDLEQLLGAGQQHRRLLAIQHELPAHQGVGVAVEGQRERLPGGPAEPHRDPLPKLLGGLAAEGEHQHPRRVEAAVADPVHHGLHDGRGLARARSGQHQQRPASVGDHSLLGVIQGGRHRRRGHRPADEAVSRRAGSHFSTAFQQKPPTFLALPASNHGTCRHGASHHGVFSQLRRFQAYFPKDVRYRDHAGARASAGDLARTGS